MIMSYREMSRHLRYFVHVFEGLTRKRQYVETEIRQDLVLHIKL